MSRITTMPHQNVHLGSFTGDRFQHFNDLLKDKDFPVGGKYSTNIVLALRKNDCSSGPQKTLIRNLKTTLTWIKIDMNRVILFLQK